MYNRNSKVCKLLLINLYLVIAYIFTGKECYLLLFLNITLFKDADYKLSRITAFYSCSQFNSEQSWTQLLYARRIAEWPLCCRLEAVREVLCFSFLQFVDSYVCLRCCGEPQTHWRWSFGASSVKHIACVPLPCFQDILIWQHREMIANGGEQWSPSLKRLKIHKPTRHCLCLHYSINSNIAEAFCTFMKRFFRCIEIEEYGKIHLHFSACDVRLTWPAHFK